MAVGRPRADLHEVRVFGTVYVRVTKPARPIVRIGGHCPHSGRCKLALRQARRLRNRHSDRAFNNHRGTRRGFLPRGLSDTCPQTDAGLTGHCARGQVSDNPKHNR